MSSSMSEGNSLVLSVTCFSAGKSAARRTRMEGKAALFMDRVDLSTLLAVWASALEESPCGSTWRSHASRFRVTDADPLRLSA